MHKNAICFFIGCFALFFGLSFFYSPLSLYGWIFLSLAGLKLVNLLANRISGFPSTVIHWIHAMVFEVFALTFVFCFRPIGRFWKLRFSGKDKRPILLVHGYINNSVVWIYHKWQLLRHGFRPLYMLNLKGPFISIAEYVKQMEKIVSQIEKETGRHDLILIGHSMGGIVSSFYATKIAPPKKVTDLITIGSPLAGTLVARIAPGSNAREMQRDSDFLKSLRKEILSHREIRVYHIATKTDQLVIPYTSAILEGPPERQLIINDIGHVSLLFSPRVSKKIISWLAQIHQI